MPLILNGTTGISGIDGSAGTPSYQGTDSDTGLWYPAANTIAWSTGGTERMRIDSSGNVGIGLTNPSTPLDVYGAINVRSGYNVQWGTSANYIAANTSLMQFGVNSAERMRITSGGDVGIGTSSPSVRLHVSTSSSGTPDVLWINNSLAVGAGVGSTLAFTGTSNNNGLASIIGAFAGATTADGGYMTFNTRAVTSGTLTERMRIDSSGNVGIGVTPNTWGSGYKAIQLTDGAVLCEGGANTYIGNNWFNDGTNKYIATGAAALYEQSGGVHAWYTAASGTGGTAVTFTERMRIDSSGNVGIGASSFPADTNLTVLGNFQTGFYRNVTSGARGYFLNIGAKTSGGFADGAYVFGAVESGDATGYLTFGTRSGSATAERMRITSGGEVYIAGTTDQGAYNLQVNGTGVWGAGAYVNGSDEKIKDKIAPLDSGLDVVAKLNPVTYKYKKDWSKDQSTQTGFIAQELLTALEGKNYIDGVVQQGGEYMSVAYQNIIPILTKAIQEQQAMIEELKQEVASLKGV